MTSQNSQAGKSSVITLPPEIRNEIYRQYFSDTTLVPSASTEVKDIPTLLRKAQNTRGSILKPQSGNVNILQISKTMAQEAEAVLFQECIFRFYLFTTSNTSSAPSQELAKRMEHIELSICASDQNPYPRSDAVHPNTIHYLSGLAGWGPILEKFTGRKVVRKRCRIRFQYWEREHHQLEVSAFFDAVEKTIGFELLTIQLDCPSYYIERISRDPKSLQAGEDMVGPTTSTWVGGNPWRKPKSGQAGEDMVGSMTSKWVGGNPRINSVPPWNYIRYDVQRALQPDLGPAIVYEDQYSLSLRCHPRRVIGLRTGESCDRNYLEHRMSRD